VPSRHPLRQKRPQAVVPYLALCSLLASLLGRPPCASGASDALKHLRQNCSPRPRPRCWSRTGAHAACCTLAQTSCVCVVAKDYITLSRARQGLVVTNVHYHTARGPLAVSFDSARATDRGPATVTPCPLSAALTLDIL